MTLSSFLYTQSGLETFNVDHDTPHMPSTSPRSTASMDSVVPYPLMTLNLVPSSALRIRGMVARSPDEPVADTVTSRSRACSMVLISLVCQVAQMVCCLAMLP